MAKSIKILGWRFSASVGHSASGTDTLFISTRRPNAYKKRRDRETGK